MNKERKRHFDLIYLEMAKLIASSSYAKKKKVGCVVVKDNTIISDGFNGTPAGFSNTCEYETQFGEITRLNTFLEVLHAEENAITKLARLGNSSQDATMYITVPPCIRCARLIVQSGLKRVVYAEPYKNTEGIDLLLKAGLVVEHIKKS